MKAKILLLIIITGLINFNLNAQTNVGGTLSSNTTWTIDGSPYTLTSTVGVPSGITLTIMPGVQISGNYDLLIKGDLISNGKADSLIDIQNTRVIFKSTNLSNSEMSYITFDIGGLQLADESEFSQDSPKNSGTLTVTDCEFKNNAYARTKGYSTSAALIIENSFFENTTIKGYYPRSETIKIDGCEFDNCTVTSDSYNEGIFVLNSTLSSTTFWVGCCGANYNINSSRLKNCELTGRESGSINLNKSILINTSFDVENDYNGGNPVYSDIDSCLFIYNSTIVTKLFNSLDEGEVEVSHSTFIQMDGNQIGIGIDNFFGNSISYSTFVNNNIAINGKVNNLNNCNFINTNEFLLKNTSSSSINATNNYWGTTEELEIKNKIYDTFDDINLGQVDYSSFLNSPDITAPISSPINIYKSSSENGITVTWNSNLETDLSGYKIYYNPVDEFTYSNTIDVGGDTTYIITGINLNDTIVVTAYDNQADGTNDLFEGHESWYSQPSQEYFTYDLISGNSYCVGDEIQYQVNTIADFNTDNNFIIQLSDTTGSFDNPINLVSVDTSTNVLITTAFPDTLFYGKSYKIRVKATNPAASSNSENVVFYQIPSAEFVLDTNKLCGADTVLVSYIGTGTGNASYNWNFNNGNIISGAGQGDYQINWSSAGLKNISLSVEENGCASTLSLQNVKVYQPSSSFSMDNVVCKNQNTSISYSGIASDSASFDWDFNGANIVSQNNEDYLVNWENLGVKKVSLIINDNGCVSSQTIQSIEHNPIPTPTFTAPEKVCYNGIANIEYLGTATSSANYNWNFNNGSILSGTGEGPYEITWGNSGIKTVSLNVTENGCSSDTSLVLSVNQQTQPISICMVSVDSSNHNMIVWEQSIDNAFDSIIVYKETSQTDVYKKIGSHFSGNKTVFIDENSNPAQNSSRYRIAVLDTCGYETSQSDYHKTMHLTINSGINGAWNLIWDGYEGFSYSTYNIYRGTSDGNMLKIAEQASNTFTYTDLIPPVGTVYYQIEVENTNSCNISNLKSTNDYFGSTRSNVVNSNQVNSVNDLSFEDIEIYPNPASDKLYIKTIATNDYDMEILSLDGKLMINYQNIQNNREFDISTLKPGIYLIKVSNDKKSMNMKLIKK